MTLTWQQYSIQKQVLRAPRYSKWSSSESLCNTSGRSIEEVSQKDRTWQLQCVFDVRRQGDTNIFKITKGSYIQNKIAFINVVVFW